MRPLIRFEKVSKTYGSDEAVVHALRQITFTLMPGERVLIVGPSGSGKTTFLSILGCLLRASSGQIHVGDQDITKNSEKDLALIRAFYFGFVFQDPHLFDALNALENVALILQLKKGAKADSFKEAEHLLERVHVAHRKKAMSNHLSGGEKQRVAIARALAGNPPILLADEPTGALDTHTAMEVMELLDELTTQEGHALVVVTHDLRLEKFADHIIKIQDGQMVNG
ncbi:MAG: ABC transporter ATP-binding protein [Chlamydiae bacterium]|nr:ABC transporter ATP-binding protein [Chlamydiota bacterium]